MSSIHPLAHDRAQLAGIAGRHVSKLPHGADSGRCQPRGRGLADAPQFFHANAWQQALAQHLVGEVADPVKLWLILGRPVGQLRQGLGRADSDAGGDAGPFPHLGADFQAIGGAVGLPNAGDVQEALVDRVDLHLRRELVIDLVHAAAHVAVQGVIAAEHGNALGPAQVADLEERRAHLDAEGVGLRRPRHGAAVVVRQHDHRPIAQLRREQALATAIEAVAVHQSEHPAGHGRRG